MKKKVLILILILLGILIFLGITYKIEIIQNLKEIINKQEENTKQITEVTKVDVTNLDSNINIEHEHIYKTMYNETNHWEECKICGEKQNEIKHTFTRTWAAGYESCSYTNYYENSCLCGYSEIGHKPCIWNGYSYYTGPSFAHMHTKLCNICKGYIIYSYYLNGILYEETDKNKEMPEYPTLEPCYASNGIRLTCDNMGTCYKCGITYQQGYHYLKENENNKIVCRLCQKEFGTITNEIIEDGKTPKIYTIITKLSLTNGLTIGNNSSDSINFFIDVAKGTATSSIINKNTTGTEVSIRTILKINSSVRKSLEEIGLEGYGTLNGKSQYFQTAYWKLKTDTIKPTILNISTENSNSWKKSRKISVSGTENWTDTVNIEILDDKSNTVYTGIGIVSNGEYSISCTPDLEAGAEGKIFTVRVTDNCDNSITREFTIDKIDSISPNPISKNEVGKEWSKTKNFIFKATDQGIGNVQIAFNDISDLQSANLNETGEYEREYEFTGDVYSPKELSVLYKDELGNTSIQKITIDKLDNTAPRITNANIHNNILSVTSNDEKEGIGEGSGVAKYRYITSTEKINNPEVPETAAEVNINEEFIIQDIYKVKYIYIIAEDLVGNISGVYEYEVPQLILTSKINLETANGKGGVELDWSDYDLEDKYFVIYRKQENETE